MEIYDAGADLAKDMADVHMMHAKYFGPSKPFYWTKVHEDPAVSAPSGWYQWQDRGLVYLGETILEPR